jgi:hypothetical protein
VIAYAPLPTRVVCAHAEGLPARSLAPAGGPARRRTAYPLAR